MIKIYIGTSGFAHKEWKGKFYPEKISSKEMLRFYAQRLNTVEVNNTFYHMPKESVLTSWAEQVPSDFVFALKAPQIITHIRQLKNVFEQTEYLFKSLSVLDRKLGAVLFQLPKSFHANAPALEDFLALIPSTAACAFEFRSPSWLDAGMPDLLRQKGCSLCIADTDENPAQEIISTTLWGYLRLRRSDYTDADLSQWAERILSQKWEKAYVYFKHEDEAKGAATAIRFQELIDTRLNGSETGRIRKAG
ncbi:MAG TPA: DUF72 domain-containing protein [Nitrospirota bacterium]|nr:DUF72 domain-containing protein [Nitrospirota bacterium]